MPSLPSRGSPSVPGCGGVAWAITWVTPLHSDPPCHPPGYPLGAQGSLCSGDGYGAPVPKPDAWAGVHVGWPWHSHGPAGVSGVPLGVLPAFPPAVPAGRPWCLGCPCTPLSPTPGVPGSLGGAVAGGSAVQPPQGLRGARLGGISRGSVRPRGMGARPWGRCCPGQSEPGPGLGGGAGASRVLVRPEGPELAGDRRIPGGPAASCGARCIPGRVGAFRGGRSLRGRRRCRGAAGALCVRRHLETGARRLRQYLARPGRSRRPPGSLPRAPPLSPPTPGPIPGRSRRSDKALRELRRERLRHDSGRTGRGRAPRSPRSPSRTPPASPCSRQPRILRVPPAPHPPCPRSPRCRGTPTTPPHPPHPSAPPAPPPAPQPLLPAPPAGGQRRPRAGGTEPGARRAGGWDSTGGGTAPGHSTGGAGMVQGHRTGGLGVCRGTTLGGLGVCRDTALGGWGCPGLQHW